MARKDSQTHLDINQRQSTCVLSVNANKIIRIHPPEPRSLHHYRKRGNTSKQIKCNFVYILYTRRFNIYIQWKISFIITKIFPKHNTNFSHHIIILIYNTHFRFLSNFPFFGDRQHLVFPYTSSDIDGGMVCAADEFLITVYSEYISKITDQKKKSVSCVILFFSGERFFHLLIVKLITQSLCRTIRIPVCVNCVIYSGV